MLRGDIVLVEISGLWLAKCGKKGVGRAGHLHLGSPPIWLQIHLVGGDRAFMCVLDGVTAGMDFREPYIDRLKVILVKDYLEGSGEGEGLAVRLLLLGGGGQVPVHRLETIHC